MLKHPTKSWILVAHRAGAIVYETESPSAPLSTVTEFDHPQGRLRAGMVESDRPGRSFDRRGGGRHALSTEESATEHDERTFASKLVAYLETARTDHRFDTVSVLAPPKLLGMLRAQMSAPLCDLVAVELAKDLGHADAETVRQLLGHA